LNGSAANGERMSRFLFVVPPLAGHVNPAVSVAHELVCHGHDVAWAGHPSVIESWLPRGATMLSVEDGGAPDLVAATTERALHVRGLESLRFLFDDFLLPLARAMLPGVERAVRDFQPAVLVVDQQAIAGGLVARRRRLPWASFATTSALLTDPLPALPKVREWLHRRLAALDEEAGLAPVEGFGLSPHLVVVFSTEALFGTTELPAHVHLVGPSITARPDDAPFPWEWFRPAPRILVTLGTVNVERGARFFRAVVESIGNEPLQVVLVARPETVGPVPANVLVRARIPQLAVLRHMQAVVCHGGHNTVCESLANGIPLVIAPVKDDQAVVARQVVDAGAGIRVNFGKVGAAELGLAVQAVLQNEAFREAARRIQTSFADAGGAVRAARLLEEMAAVRC
jgi:MGT family glycosyltransferase